MMKFSDFLVMNRETAISTISKNEIVNTYFNSFSSLKLQNAIWGLCVSGAGRCRMEQLFGYINLPFDIDNEMLRLMFKFLSTHCIIN